jgi:transposase
VKKRNKQQYRIRNWKDYNSSLTQRGSLTIWFDLQAIQSWLNHKKPGHRGKPRTYGDACILCMLVLKSVYHLPQRSTHGLVCSLMQLMKLDLPVPHPTILSRRASTLEVTLPRQKINQPLHVLVDASGLKVYGEGEWKVRQHGYSKRRTWRKLHLAMEARSGEILAAVATTNDLGDKQVMCDLLEQVEEKITKVTADGGYDYATCYDDIAKRKARAVIPPRRTAKLNPQDERFRARDRNLREIRKLGRKKWKKKKKYHRRSLVETCFCRIKTIFGEKLSARKFENQATEMFVRCGALNRMTHLGMPKSKAV